MIFEEIMKKLFNSAQDILINLALSQEDDSDKKKRLSILYEQGVITGQHFQFILATYQLQGA